MRDLSFLLRPVFAANDDWAMARGEESLRLELERRHTRRAGQRALILRRQRRRCRWGRWWWGCWRHANAAAVSRAFDRLTIASTYTRMPRAPLPARLVHGLHRSEERRV